MAKNNHIKTKMMKAEGITDDELSTTLNKNKTKNFLTICFFSVILIIIKNKL